MEPEHVPNQTQATAQSVDTTQQNTPHGIVLPNITDLFGTAWNFVVSNKSFVLWYIAPFLVIALGSMVMENSDPFGVTYDAFYSVVTAVMVLATLLMYCNTGALLYAVHQRNQTVSYVEGLRWTFSNLLGLFWTFLVSTVLIMIGYILLIIPGIIISVFICFAPFVLYHEGKMGFAAVQASYRTVKGHWSQVFVKFLVLFGLMVLCSFAVGIVFAIFSALLLQGAVANTVAYTLLNAAYGVLGVMGMFIIARLYEALRVGNS